uniref:Zinc finger E-box-binding homeobox 1 n=1 Tax=Gouania willdenowi TaxID=441366 RepID=A0A8C5HLU7_GOUWI
MFRVTAYNNLAGAGSDSDDEDKLHIVEEEGSLADRGEFDSTGLDEEHHREHCWDPVKEDCVSDVEDDMSTDAMVAEMLQQGATAVIYPEGPDDEPPRQDTPDTSVHDENGNPDSFSQLLTCPYCARGYKRYSSLKEHIKYRHEKTEESFSCPECSYNFTYRAQLERHMTVHKREQDQKHITQPGGNRKFKCTECGKAFKYKHHLKEHLRIHSGEKPYECSNCKKRFSHSGSYSSHISSKKCIGIISVNSRASLGSSKIQRGPSPGLHTQPSVVGVREKHEHSKPLQEQLPLHQIKTEPVDYECKPTVLTSTPVANINCGVFGGGATAPLQGTVQAVVLPTLGLVSPIRINISDLQNALKAPVDGKVLQQVLENSTKGQMTTVLSTGMLQQQQLISAISLPIVGQDGNTKIIINYSLDPNQAKLTSTNLKKEPSPISPSQDNIDTFKSQKHPEDLTIRGSRASEINKSEVKTTKTCLLCDKCPSGLDSLHELKHCKKVRLSLNEVCLDKSESAVVALLSEEGLCTQPKNLLSLLKAYFALNAEPTKEELLKISNSVSLPIQVVTKWFDKMQEGQISLGAPTPPSEEEDNVVSLVLGRDRATLRQSVTKDSPTEATTPEVNGTHCLPAASSPLNLTAGQPSPAEPPKSTEGPLDLSLPKSLREETERAASGAWSFSVSLCSATNEDEPLNLTCTKRKVSPLSAMGQCPALYASQPSAKPLDIVTTMRCLKALANNKKQTILTPQLAYTTTANSPTGTDGPETLHLNGIKEEELDTSFEVFSTKDEQIDSDSGLLKKKMKRTDSGLYACDLCDKIFQKSSSLLRHKYEHTGKRPHECGICSKAFKHKHHLIEHMRLHSGEKPYQCDKCGKRFSHSGSYSQHMNHRYSYCKKEEQSEAGGQHSLEDEDGDAMVAETEARGQQLHLLAASHMDSDERGSSTREDESEEEDEEVFEGVVDMADIQVVQVGNEGGNEEEKRVVEEKPEAEETQEEETIQEEDSIMQSEEVMVTEGRQSEEAEVGGEEGDLEDRNKNEENKDEEKEGGE